MKNLREFREELYSTRLPDCFNPYLETCPVFDRVDAVEIRRKNLEALFQAIERADTIDLWVGRDLGYRGGRRTGLALADEFSLDLFAKKSGAVNLKKSTVGPVQKERTATIVREALILSDVPVLTWNVFPFHPFSRGKSFSNRNHTRSEFEIGVKFLAFLCQSLPIRNAIGIGRDAYSSLQLLTPNCLHARHPSYGGQAEFLRQIRETYSGAVMSYQHQGELGV